MVAGDRVDRLTVPFIYYLYELYGAPATEDPESLAGIGYDEPSFPTAADGPGLAAIVRESPRIRRHVIHALRLFDALFLRVKPGAENEPLHWRYDESAYHDVKTIFREVAGEMLARPDDALNRTDAKPSEYSAALEEIPHALAMVADPKPTTGPGGSSRESASSRKRAATIRRQTQIGPIGVGYVQSPESTPFAANLSGPPTGAQRIALIAARPWRDLACVADYLIDSFPARLCKNGRHGRRIGGLDRARCCSRQLVGGEFRADRNSGRRNLDSGRRIAESCNLRSARPR